MTKNEKSNLTLKISFLKWLQNIQQFFFYFILITLSTIPSLFLILSHTSINSSFSAIYNSVRFSSLHCYNILVSSPINSIRHRVGIISLLSIRSINTEKTELPYSLDLLII